MEKLIEKGKRLGEVWEENRLPKSALALIPPEKWEECLNFLGEYPRKESLLTKWGDTAGWERWILSVLSIKVGVKLHPSLPDIEGVGVLEVADRFLKKKATISELRAAVKVAKGE